MLPNFFVVGAQKCATTSFHEYLSGHPNVYLPRQKETKFFVSEKVYSFGIDFYESEYFSGWSGEKMVGEVDPDYMYFKDTIRRMREHLEVEKVKFIFIFRNPIDRAFSHYLMTLRRGLEPLGFEEALACEKKRIVKDYVSRLHYSYLDRGFYYQQVVRFLRYIEQSQMFFLLLDDLENDEKASLKMLLSFLNISTDYAVTNRFYKFHYAKVPRSMFLLRRIKGRGIEKNIIRFAIPFKKIRERILQKLLDLNETQKMKFKPSIQTRRMLSDIYYEENQLLGKLIGRDLSHWDYPNSI
jgi:hypothetical protein